MTAFKHDLFNQRARLSKAVSNWIGLQFVEFLEQNERGVNEPTSESGLAGANSCREIQ